MNFILRNFKLTMFIGYNYLHFILYWHLLIKISKVNNLVKEDFV